MRVFVTGATGVFGHRIVQRLADSGHDVLGQTRDDAGGAVVRDCGGVPVMGDLLDREKLQEALDGREVDVVVHAATKLPPVEKPGADYWEKNDRVRRAGAENLLAVLGDRIEQFVFPSVVWVARQPDGSPFDEESDRHPDLTTQSAADVEDMLLGVERNFTTTVLRLGFFYGPDCRHTRSFASDLLSGDLPVVGGGLLGRNDAEWSLIHVADAARAVVTAVDGGLDGLYHVVDDEPVTVADYFSTLAELLEAPEPSRVPWWVARPLAGKTMVKFLTTPMPTTSERFQRETDWEPLYPTYRDGLQQVVDTWRSDGTLDALRESDTDATVPSFRETEA